MSDRLKQEWKWASKTHLLRILSGSLPKSVIKIIEVFSNLAQIEDPLTEQVKNWWEMEAYASTVKASGKTKDEEISWRIIEDLTQIDGER